MIKHILSSMENAPGAIAALVIFATVFAGYTYWTLRKENKARYEEAGTLPLSDGEAHE